MAPLPLLNATPFIGGYDYTGDSNKLTLEFSLADLNTTTFANTGFVSRTGGLKDSVLHGEGLWSSGVDAEAFPKLGTVDEVATVSPTPASGSVAYMFQVAKLKYSTFGQVGDLMPWALDTSGSNMTGPVRGQVAAAKQSVSATGALTPATGLNLGAVGSTQFLYATFHVFTAGTTITAVVESATANTFASPTTRMTIGPLTTTGGTWATRVAGPITDTWWRVRVSAITGTFSVAAAIGIQ